MTVSRYGIENTSLGSLYSAIMKMGERRMAMHAVVSGFVRTIETLDPEKNAILIIAFMAFLLVGFSLYVVLQVIKALSRRKENG